MLVIGNIERIEPYPGDAFAILTAPASDVRRIIGERDVVLLVIGSGTSLDVARSLIDIAKDYPPDKRFVSLVLAASNVSDFQEQVERNLVYYISRRMLSSTELRSLIVSCVARARPVPDPGTPTLSAALDELDGFADLWSRLSAQEEVRSTATLIAEKAGTLIRADHSEYLIFDGDKDSLWSGPDRSGSERLETSATGLGGFVARTGEPLRVPNAASDPRFDPDLDGPGGTGQIHYAAEPVFGLNHEVMAVLTVTRDASADPFSDSEVRYLQLLAAGTAPWLSLRLLQDRVDADLLKRTLPGSGAMGLFRREAMDDLSRRSGEEGTLLRTCPPWLRLVHGFSLALLAVGLLFLVLARVAERAEGPGVVRARSKTAIVASESGLVSSVAVARGDQVRAGDPLIQFLRWNDASAEPLTSQLRAPHDGIVSNLRVFEGQQINPGDQVATIIDETAGYEVVAFLPASYAPQLGRGMPMVSTIDGYADSHEVSPAASVSAETVEPREAAHYAGKDALAVTGAVVIVEAVLSSSRFASGGQVYPYRDGMGVRAEISVRSEPLLLSLIPGLKDLIHAWR